MCFLILMARFCGQRVLVPLTLTLIQNSNRNWKTCSKRSGGKRLTTKAMLYCPKKMEEIGSSSNADHHHDHSSGGSGNAAGKEHLTEKQVFVNHAELAWHQMRTEWVGDQSKKLQRPPKGSIISQTATYQDMLLSREHFQPPIPLSEVVSFLVELWYQEDLCE